ncbi:MAG: ribosome assembly RNA-binding protein YhbY [Herpetosiphonaceae bacterium]|nr:ribosome assembly RNA-binding protein YhbY [Herpetosiphonaceae bacterium]
MLNLNSGQRQYLRRLAHDLRPVVQIGKQGLTAAVIAAVDTALTAHELIKVKFGEFKDEKSALADQLTEATDSALVGLVGNVAILFREHPEPTERQIVLP